MELVERLRHEADGAEFSSRYADLVGEAADRIEQLERELAAEEEMHAGCQKSLEGMGRKWAAEKALADDLAEIVENCDVSTGYCCCGDRVDSHGMGSGHSPVDEGAYHAEKVLAAYRKARGL